VDRRGRALACEVIGGEKSLSLNFSRAGIPVQYPRPDEFRERSLFLQGNLHSGQLSGVFTGV
jgi:hypothetical protein